MNSAQAMAGPDHGVLRYLLKNLRRQLGASWVALVKEDQWKLLGYNGVSRYRKFLGNILALVLPDQRAESFQYTAPGESLMSVSVCRLAGKGLLLAGVSGQAKALSLDAWVPRRELRTLERFLQDLDRPAGSESEDTIFSDGFFRRVPFGVMVMDFQGKIVEWNERMSVLSGWTKGEVIGHRYSEYLLCDIPLESLLRGMLFSDSLFLRNYRFLNRQQEEFLMNVHLFLWEKDHRSPRVVFVIEDVTEKARLGENVRQIEKLSTLGRFISGIAHEINNPLAVIYGYSQMLLQNLDRGTENCRACKNVHRGLERIEDEAEHCGKLIQNLIDFSKPMSLQRDATDINLLIKESLSLMDIYLLQGKKMEFDFTPDLPEVMVDRLKMKQVFINLGKNAFEAMTGEHGRLVLSTRLQILASPPGNDLSLVLPALEARQHNGIQYIEVTFSDNGEGISRDTIHHIFEPFYTTKDRGTGLGLSICYGIVKTHGGWIEIDSPGDDDQGTRVMVFLPVEAKEA